MSILLSFWHSDKHSQTRLFLPWSSTNFLDWGPAPLSLMNLSCTFIISSHATYSL